MLNNYSELVPKFRHLNQFSPASLRNSQQNSIRMNKNIGIKIKRKTIRKFWERKKQWTSVCMSFNILVFRSALLREKSSILFFLIFLTKSKNIIITIIYIYIYIYIYMCVCVCVCVYVCSWSCIRLCVYVCVCALEAKFDYVCMCVCVLLKLNSTMCVWVCVCSWS